jgi:putative membrane protein
MAPPNVAESRVDPASFPWIQTRLALERTLMAWVRTAAALIGFGFTIFQFYELLNTLSGVRPPVHPHASRLLGASLVGIGTLALGLALVQYSLLVRALGASPPTGIAGIPRFHPGFIVAVFLTAVGAVTFWVLVARLPT